MMSKTRVRSNKKLAYLAITLMIVTGMLAVNPATAAGETLTTTKSQIKVNVPIKFTAGALTVSTYYTLYAETVLKGNQSTSATSTSIEFQFVVGDEYIDTWVTVSVNDVTGATPLATYEIQAVAVIPQYTIDMLGGFMPLIMVFGVVFGVMGGVIAVVMRIFK